MRIVFAINGESGHWEVHVEKPDFVIRAVKRFLNKELSVFK